MTQHFYSDNVVYLDRDDDEALARVATLQALFRVQIPANAQVRLEKLRTIDEIILGQPPRFTQAFLTPRRFVLWAVKEGLVPDQFRQDALRYARA